MPAINWPIEALNIVPPIIFIVLVIVFPLIGLAAGWKRAAFWGGGNLLFFLIGMLIWRFAGVLMVNPFIDKLTQLLISVLPEGTKVTPQLVVSLLAPIWFILWMAISELILLINYYAWYKKVVGLKKIGIKDKKTGKIKKEYAKISPKAGTIGYKLGNRLGGVALLGALTLPSTFTFVQMAYFGLTSVETRLGNGMSNNIYNGLKKANNIFNWMSYYLETDVDFDAIWGAFKVVNIEITYKDPDTGEEKTMDIFSYAENVIAKGVEEEMKQIAEFEDPEKAAEGLGNTINTVGEFWNQVVEQGGTSVESVFNSPNAVTFVSGVVQGIVGEQTQFEIKDADFEGLFAENGFMDQILTEYEEEKTIGGIPINDIQQISTKQENINEFAKIFQSIINTDGLHDDPEGEGAMTKEEKIAEVNKTIDGLLKIFFKLPGQLELETEQLTI